MRRRAQTGEIPHSGRSRVLSRADVEELLSEHFSVLSSSSSPTQAKIEKWWATLSDPELNALVARAAESNLDIKIATSRLLEARAARRITRADLLPSINSVNSFQRIRGGFENGNIHVANSPGGNIFVAPFESNIFQIGFDASWEIDLFGGKRPRARGRHSRSSRIGRVASRCPRRLLGEGARNYVELRGAQRRLQIGRSDITLQQDSLHLAQVRAEAGLGNQLDVERQKEQVEATRIMVAKLMGPQVRTDCDGLG
jgi:outer membrane protein, multidrug efflux system